MPAEPYPIEDLAVQARELLVGAGHAQVDVVGVSLGGLVALRLAADAPDLVRRLVVVDAVAVYPEPMREMWRDRASRAPAEGVEPFLDPTLALWFTADRLAEGGPVVEAARHAFLAGDARGYGLACQALGQVDVTGVMDRITAPTLVVCGEDDAPPFTAAARELGGRLPDARVVWLSPARHAGVLEQPEQFREALVGFLGEGRAEVARCAVHRWASSAWG